MKLELFHRWQCPYSAKVRNFIERNNLVEQINYREIGEDAKSASALQQLTGKKQVPCLVIDGKPMLESDDIISWLKNNLAGHQEMQAT